MKAVLISIRPRWVELIASGKKTVEVRKTAPNAPTPFKVYMYMTRIPWAFDILRAIGMHKTAACLLHGFGKVVGEFVCDGTAAIRFEPFDDATHALDGFYQWWDTKEDWALSLTADSCLKHKEFVAYLKDKGGSGWHISDLVIYDKPQKLSEFGITRPPQSWRYVEYVGEGET